MVIRLTNAKAIEDGLYEFPDTGIVQFKGGNSNGKSILLHVLADILKMDIMSDEARGPLIRDNCDEMSLQMIYKEKQLIVFLNRDRSLCRIAYRRSEAEEIIVRSLREGGWKEIFEEFGFVVSNDSFVLQIYETYGKMPFVNMSPTETYNLVETLSEDSVAKAFLANYKDTTHNLLKNTYAAAKQNITTAEYKLQSLPNIDCIAYEEMKRRLEAVYPYVKHLKLMELEKVMMPPKVSILPIPKMSLPAMLFLNVYPIMPALENVSEKLRQHTALLDGKCPTCGRLFIEGGVECCLEGSVVNG